MIFNSGAKNERIDYIRKENQLKPHHFNPDWPDTVNAINVNYYDLDQVVPMGDTVRVELKWSYHFSVGPPQSTPIFHINAYSRWKPDEPIHIFEGMLKGEGSDTLYFEFISPRKVGTDTIRVFFASSYGPITSYYGHPGDNMPSRPATAPYIEIPIEVVK